MILLRPKRRHGGFTLVEMMVAMVLGLFLASVAFKVYIENMRTFRQGEQLGRMQENARYAMYVLSQELKMAGFFGTMVVPSDISQDAGVATPALDCGASGVSWLFDLSPPIAFLANTTGSAANAAHQCVSSSDFKANGSLLAVKRVAGATSGSLTNGQVYLRSNGSVGVLFQNPTTPSSPASGYDDWQYQVKVFTIRSDTDTAGDGVPALMLQEMVVASGNPTMEAYADADLLVEGIEAFVVTFGVDANSDGTADYFLSNPTDAQLGQTVAARLFILARAVDAETGYTDSKTYTLGDQTYGPFNDGFHRRVYTTTVVIRNLANQLAFTT